jgi:tetratricopeptide (TPR) repeat protein
MSFAVLLAIVLLGPATAQEVGEIKVPPPAKAVELYNQGLELAQGSKFREARVKFEEALTIAPDFSEASYNLGLVLRQIGENEAAVEALQKSIDGAPQPALACRILAETLVDLGRTQEAVDKYKNAIELDPEMKELHYVIADLLYKSAKTDEEKQGAIIAYLNALKEAPRHPSARRAYRTLAKLYYKQANREKALEMYVKASKLDPKDAELHYNCGVLYNQVGKPKEAVASLKKATELKNPNGKAYYALAGIYYNKLSMDEEAVAAYESAAKDPDFNKVKEAKERAQMIRDYLEQKAAAKESPEEGN